MPLTSTGTRGPDGPDGADKRVPGRVVVQRVIAKRVGAPVAAGCYIDNSPPPPPREEAVAVAARDRGTGGPTKRERRSIEKLLGRPAR
jgi:ribosome-associated heat shock protein Hsp15